jgi:hypothetical protein
MRPKAQALGKLQKHQTPEGRKRSPDINLVAFVPQGTHSFPTFYPGLTPWATFFRASRLRVLAELFHSSKDYGGLTPGEFKQPESYNARPAHAPDAQAH